MITFPRKTWRQRPTMIYHWINNSFFFSSVCIAGKLVSILCNRFWIRMESPTFIHFLSQYLRLFTWQCSTPCIYRSHKQQFVQKYLFFAYLYMTASGSIADHYTDSRTDTGVYPTVLVPSSPCQQTGQSHEEVWLPGKSGIL